ncbi:hypothetical protein BUALT_Bualt07G0016400 [Buddleja alternifolia]|uniref:Cytochrome P450 n=1 Tax=Buddleja alternifolia TaxID=168488 RepID=A0AAV6X8A1_9LAMI|nr:hypothetical protein BUALT_Bualt07G0016400 [Buddleja alternifolia]
MLLHFGNVPTLIVSSADSAREIMKIHDLTFINRPESSISRRLLYDNKDISVAPYGEYWRQLKSICVLQLLSNKRVQSFHSIREEETALLVKKVGKFSGFVNLSEMFTEITNDVVCRSAFGRKYSEGENGKKFIMLLKEFLKLLGSINIGEFIPWLSWINSVNGFDSRVDKVSKELDEFLERVIQERLENPTEEAFRKKNGENFVDILLEIYKNNTTGVSIDRDSIKAIILGATGGTEVGRGLAVGGRAVVALLHRIFWVPIRRLGFLVVVPIDFAGDVCESGGGITVVACGEDRGGLAAALLHRIFCVGLRWRGLVARVEFWVKSSNVSAGDYTLMDSLTARLQLMDANEDDVKDINVVAEFVSSSGFWSISKLKLGRGNYETNNSAH